LASDGLLDLTSEELEPEVAVVPAAPVAPVVAPVAPTPTNERIVREIRRPRAGLGIRTRETVGGPSLEESNKPPSVEELDNLSDEQPGKLLQAVRQQRLGNLALK